MAAQSSFILDFRRDERLGVSFSRPDAPMTNRSGLIPDYVPPIPISSCSVSACIYQESTTRRSSRAVLNRKTSYYRCRCLVCVACSASYWLDRIEAKETLGNRSPGFSIHRTPSETSLNTFNCVHRECWMESCMLKWMPGFDVSEHWLR